MKKIFLIILITLIPAIYFLIQYSKKNSALITVERTVNAPIEKVWSLWTETDSIQKWWGPKDYTAPVIKNDFHLNGTFLFSMKAPDGKITWNTGKYLGITHHQRIVSIMSFADENGKVVPASQYDVPGEWPPEVPLMVDFTDLQGKTKITVKENSIPMIMYLFAKLGWEQQLDKFEKLLN